MCTEMMDCLISTVKNCLMEIGWGAFRNGKQNNEPSQYLFRNMLCSAGSPTPPHPQECAVLNPQNIVPH